LAVKVPRLCCIRVGKSPGEGFDRESSLHTHFDLPRGSRAGNSYIAPLLPKLCLKPEKCGGHSWFRTNIMPPDNRSPQDAFNINILDPQALDTPGGLQNALRTIEAVCYQGDPEITRMVEALSDRSYILEYIISGALRMPIGLCTLPTLIISPSSVGGRGICEALKLDDYTVSQFRNARSDRCHGRAAPTEILIFVAIRGVSIRC
jgi:hypothetical protein